jgi:hypothetical protein
MKLTPTTAREVLLNLTLLDLLIMAEALMVLNRLHILKQPADSDTETKLLSTWKDVSDTIFDARLDHTTPIYYHSRMFKVIIDWDYWRNKDPVFPEDVLVWFTDGSIADSGTGSGIFGLSLCLGKFATVFQTERYAILKCTVEHQFTNAPVHEQFSSRTNFPSNNRLG